VTQRVPLDAPERPLTSSGSKVGWSSGALSNHAPAGSLVFVSVLAAVAVARTLAFGPRPKKRTRGVLQRRAWKHLFRKTAVIPEVGDADDAQNATGSDEDLEQRLEALEKDYDAVMRTRNEERMAFYKEKERVELIRYQRESELIQLRRQIEQEKEQAEAERKAQAQEQMERLRKQMEADIGAELKAEVTQTLTSKLQEQHEKELDAAQEKLREEMERRLAEARRRGEEEKDSALRAQQDRFREEFLRLREEMQQVVQDREPEAADEEASGEGVNTAVAAARKGGDDSDEVTGVEAQVPRNGNAIDNDDSSSGEP